MSPGSNSAIIMGRTRTFSERLSVDANFMATFSRGRKPKKRIEQRPKIEKIKEKRQGLLLRFVKYCVTHWVAALIGLVAALIAVGTPIWQAFVDPDADISEAGVDFTI